MVWAQNLYEKNKNLKNIKKPKKIRPFEVFGLKTPQNQNLKNHIFHPCFV